MATNPTIKPRRGTSEPGVGAIAQNELAVDTTNKRIYIGAADGSGTLVGSAPGGSSTQVQFNDGGNVGGSSGLIFSKTSFDLTIGGDIAVNGGDITSTATTFNLLNTTVTNLNLGGAATTMAIGNTATAAQTVNMFTASTGASTYNFATGATNFNTKTINLGAGGTVNSTTNINIGSSTGPGTTTINGTLTVTGISVHQSAGSFNSTLTVTGVTTLQGASTLQGAVNANSTLTVTGVSVHQGAGSFNSTLTVTGVTTLQSTLAVGGNTISSASTTFNLLNTTVTSLNIGGAANTVNIGANNASIEIGGSGGTGGTINLNGNFIHKGISASLFNGNMQGLFTSNKSGTFTVFTVATGDLFAIEPDPAALGLEFVFGGVSNTFIGDYSAQGNSTYIKVDDQNNIIKFNGPIGSLVHGVVTSNDHLGVNLQKDFRFYDLDGSNYVGFKSPATVTANNIWILPAEDGSAGQVLTTDGADNLTWTTPPALDLFLFSQGII